MAIFDFHGKERPNIRKRRKRQPAEEQKSFLKRAFMECDTNHDNQLSRGDLKRAFEKLGAVFPSFRASRALVYADANNDGKISLDNELDDLVNYAYKLGYTAS